MQKVAGRLMGMIRHSRRVGRYFVRFTGFCPDVTVQILSGKMVRLTPCIPILNRDGIALGEQLDVSAGEYCVQSWGRYLKIFKEGTCVSVEVHDIREILDYVAPPKVSRTQPSYRKR